VFRHVFIWAGIAGTIVLTGVASGVMVYLLSSHEWGSQPYTGTSASKHIISSLPYFWLILTTLLLGLAVVNSRWLRRGYSVRPSVYFCFYGVAALLVGVVVAEMGAGGPIEEAVAPYIPAYQKMVVRPQDDWYMPEQGMIAGHLVESTEKGVSFDDCHGGRWIIDTTKAQWRCGAENVPGLHVKLIGTMQTVGAFAVAQVIPWDVTLAGMDRCVRNRTLAPWRP